MMNKNVLWLSLPRYKDFLFQYFNTLTRLSSIPDNLQLEIWKKKIGPVFAIKHITCSIAEKKFGL